MDAIIRRMLERDGALDGEIGVAQRRHIERKFRQAEFFSQGAQIGAALLGDAQDGRAQLRGEHQRPAIGVKHFGAPLGARDGIGPANDAVIGEEHGVVRLHVGKNSFSKGLGARRFIGRYGDVAHDHFEFRNNQIGREAAGDCVGSGVGRMTMNDSLSIGHSLVDFEMEKQLARSAFAAGELISVEIDEANVLGREVEFADQRRRAEDGVGAEAKRDVAAVTVDILAHPELAAGSADFIFDGFGFRGRKNRAFGFAPGGRLAGGLVGLGGSASSRGRVDAFLLTVLQSCTSSPKEHFRLRGGKCRRGL